MRESQNPDTQFDHHDPEHYQSAEQVWSDLQTQPGLAYSSKYGGFFIATRYADVREVAMDYRRFCSGQGINIPPLPLHAPMIPVELDPPMHGPFRRLMQDCISRDRVSALRMPVQGFVTELFDALREARQFDFVAAIARPLAVKVAMQLIGLPVADAEWLHERLTIQRKNRGEAGRRAAAEVGRYIESAIERHQGVAHEVTESILSAVTLGRIEDRALTREEQVSVVRLMLFGGFDTTALALGRTLYWLASHPNDLERLRGMDDNALDVAIEEFVRFASPGSYIRRTATAPSQLSGCPLESGDRILMAYIAANRDPIQFERPHEVVLDRTPNPHLGFGIGAHRCLGSPIGKLEIQLVLRELLQRWQSICLDPAQAPRWECEEGLGIIALPLCIEPRRARSAARDVRC